MHRYPTLVFIDQALGTHCRRFADSPNALALERRARQLVDEYWSENVWLTGRISESAFRAVCSVLEQERIPEPDDVTLIVAPVMTDQESAAWTEIGSPAFRTEQNAALENGHARVASS